MVHERIQRTAAVGTGSLSLNLTPAPAILSDELDADRPVGVRLLRAMRT